MGPKLSATYSRREGLHSNVDPDLSFAASQAFAVGLGFEAGFRVQLGRADLTFMLPSVSLGVSTDPVEVGVGQLGSGYFAYDFDFNLVRLGVSL